MHLKNRKKLYNERGITFFHETERYVNNLNIYNRSKNGTNLWDDLIDEASFYKFHFLNYIYKDTNLHKYPRSSYKRGSRTMFSPIYGRRNRTRL